MNYWLILKTMRYLLAKIGKRINEVLSTYLCIKILLKKFNIKNIKLKTNNNICKISHLPFDMLCYFFQRKIILRKMHWYESICPIVISVFILLCCFYLLKTIGWSLKPTCTMLVLERVSWWCSAYDVIMIS